MIVTPHVTPAQITQAIARVEELGARHWRPLLQAVRDYYVVLFTVTPHAGAFRPAHDGRRPLIALIGDDTDAAFGPDAFDRKSLRYLIRATHGGIIVSSGPMPGVYGTAAALAAVGRRNVLLIETRPEKEFPWVKFIEGAAPRPPLLNSTVKGGTA